MSIERAKGVYLYAHDGKRHHCYFLKADKSLGDPDLRHFNVTQGHAVSDDLVNWEHLGTCLTPWRDGPAWDDKTTWTGSVVQDDEIFVVRAAFSIELRDNDVIVL